MQDIYRRLGEGGYKKNFVQSLLPEWWDNQLPASPSGLQQTGLILGRLLGVNPETIWTEGADISLSLPAKRKFKRRIDANENELDIACAIAVAAGRMAVRAMKKPFDGSALKDAAELRDEIIQSSQWVGLRELLSYCYRIGLPVIHLDHFPRGAKKMAGLAFKIEGRPVIVLTQPRKRGFALFDLAHELGHVTLGHISEGQLLVDSKIDQDSEDEDEKAANRFALQLLTGDPDCRIVPTGRNLTGSELATAAQRFGTDRKVDPAHVALNYGYTQGHWGVANLAVNELAGTSETDQELLRGVLFDSLSLEDMSEDELSALRTYCGVAG
jgi:Zn-dependent peptidase ImmA (M78 family)